MSPPYGVERVAPERGRRPSRLAAFHAASPATAATCVVLGLAVCAVVIDALGAVQPLQGGRGINTRVRGDKQEQ